MIKFAVPTFDFVVSTWKLVKIVLGICLVLFALRNIVSVVFPEAPCHYPALFGHPSQCSHDEGLPENPVVSADFVTLARLQRRLERVIEESSRVSSVVVHIKYSETALLDLETVVRRSSIASKDMLERDIKRFVTDGKATSRNLQQFGNHVWEAVDRIVALNQYTIATLEWTAVVKSLGAPGRSFSDNIRSLTYAAQGWVTGHHPESIENLWLQTIELMETTLRNLIHEAQDNAGSLQRLEERLHNIENVVVVERKGIRAAEQTLKRQWFRQRLGLNDEQLQEHSAGLGLLQMVHDERNHALHQVSTVLTKLEQMSKDLEDLREKMGTPLVVGTSSRIPIEAHIKSIQTETERLTNGFSRTRMPQIRHGGA